MTHTIPQFHKDRIKIFGRNTPTFLCFTSAFTGKPRLDVIALDDWIEETCGPTPDGISLSMRIEELYGKEGVSFCLKYLQSR